MFLDNVAKQNQINGEEDWTKYGTLGDNTGDMGLMKKMNTEKSVGEI